MKNIAIALSLLLGVPTVILAQESDLPMEVQQEEKISKRLKMMAEELQLTETQIDQVKVIHKNYKPHLENARIIEDKAKKKEAIKALKKAERAEVEALLTADQLPLLEAYVEKRKASKNRNGAKRTPAPAQEKLE